MDLEQINKAILGAMLYEGWVSDNITDNDTNMIQASYSIRSHQVSMDISYSSEQIVFKYATSTNMNYKAKKKKQLIHPNYIVWTSNLADKIETNINLGKRYSYEKDIAEASKLTNLAPSQPFSNFAQFKIENATLENKYQGHKGNESTVTNIDHNLKLKLGPRLSSLNVTNNTGKTLLIKPHVQAVRFIGNGARFWTGMMAGNSWIFVKINFIDEQTDELIAQAELFRRAAIGNGFTLAKNDYRMVEDMAGDIGRYFEMNYEQAVGGGRIPTKEERQSFKK